MEHHNLHDLLHWPTMEFRFYYSHVEVQVDDGALLLYDSQWNRCDPSSA